MTCSRSSSNMKQSWYLKYPVGCPRSSCKYSAQKKFRSEAGDRIAKWRGFFVLFCFSELSNSPGPNSSSGSQETPPPFGCLSQVCLLGILEDLGGCYGTGANSRFIKSRVFCLLKKAGPCRNELATKICISHCGLFCFRSPCLPTLPPFPTTTTFYKYSWINIDFKLGFCRRSTWLPWPGLHLDTTSMPGLTHLNPDSSGFRMTCFGEVSCGFWFLS